MNEAVKDSEWYRQKFLYPNGTLKNKLNITDAAELAQKEYDQIDAQFKKMVSLVDDAEEKTGDKYDAYKKAKDLYQRDPSSANKASMQ